MVKVDACPGHPIASSESIMVCNVIKRELIDIWGSPINGSRLKNGRISFRNFFDSFFKKALESIPFK